MTTLWVRNEKDQGHRKVKEGQKHPGHAKGREVPKISRLSDKRALKDTKEKKGGEPRPKDQGDAEERWHGRQKDQRRYAM